MSEMREPVIRSLTLGGFRSIAAARIMLDNPTFLVGRNGSGKSNVVDAFALLAEATSSSLSSAISKRGGAAVVFHRTTSAEPSLDFGLDVQFGRIDAQAESGRFAFLARALRGDRGYKVIREVCEVRGTIPASYDRQGGLSLPGLDLPTPHTDPSSLLLPAAGGLEAFNPILRTLSNIRAYMIEPDKLRGAQSSDKGSSLLPHGENAASVLREIQSNSPEDLEQIQEFLTASLPYEIRAQAVQYGAQLSLEFLQTSQRGSLDLAPSGVSDGTLRLLGLLLAVFQNPAPPVILIEEPEVSLHPGNLGLVMDLIKVASHRSQVIVTTHSPELLDSAKWIEDRHLRIVYWEDGSTRISRIGRASHEALKEHLMGAGELFRSNLLDNPPPVAKEETEVTLFEALP